MLKRRPRHPSLPWRVAAAWLLAVAMLVGPAGIGVSVAWAKTCGASCPCDDADGSHDGDHAGHAGHADHGDAHHDAGEPCRHADGPEDEDCPEDCPDDCPDCGCCAGVVLAVMPLTLPSLPVPWDSLTTQQMPGAQPGGALFNVYRPPRSST